MYLNPLQAEKIVNAPLIFKSDKMNRIHFLKIFLLFLFFIIFFESCTEGNGRSETLLVEIYTDSEIKRIYLKPKDIEKVGINQRLGDTRIELTLALKNATKLGDLMKDNVGKKIIIKTNTEIFFSGNIYEPIIGRIVAFPCSSENQAKDIINKLGRISNYHLKLTPDELQASKGYKELFSNSQWVKKAINAQAEQDFEKAEEYTQKAIQENPNLPSNHQLLSSIYYAQGLKKKALEKMLIAERLSKEKDLEKFPGIYLSIGDLYAHFKEYKKAIQYFKKVLVVHENNTLAHLGLAGAYEMLGKTDFALKEYTIVLESNDENLKDKVSESIRRLKSIERDNNR